MMKDLINIINSVQASCPPEYSIGLMGYPEVKELLSDFIALSPFNIKWIDLPKQIKPSTNGLVCHKDAIYIIPILDDRSIKVYYK